MRYLLIMLLAMSSPLYAEANQSSGEDTFGAIERANAINSQKENELNEKERNAALAEFAIDPKAKENPFKELDDMIASDEAIKQAREQGRKEMYDRIKDDIHEKCVYHGCGFKLMPYEFMFFH